MPSAKQTRREASGDRRASHPCLKATILIVCVAIIATASLAQEQPPPPPVKHTISVKFDYDFTSNHACSSDLKKKCVARFNVYDISGTKPYKLFTIPAPAGANGPVKEISGDSQPLLFEPGKHLLAVTAQFESGEESSPYACSVWVQIP